MEQHKFKNPSSCSRWLKSGMMNIHEIISLHNLLYIFYNYTVYGPFTNQRNLRLFWLLHLSDYSNNTPGVLPHLHACKHVKSVLTHITYAVFCGQPSYSTIYHYCTLSTHTLHISWTADEKAEWKSGFTMTTLGFKNRSKEISDGYTLISEAFSNMACLEDNSAWEMEKSPSRAFWARTLAICRSYSICEQTSTHVNNTGHRSTASTESTPQQQHLGPLSSSCREMAREGWGSWI